MNDWDFLLFARQKGGRECKCFVAVSFELINEFNDDELFIAFVDFLFAVTMFMVNKTCQGNVFSPSVGVFSF